MRKNALIGLVVNSLGFSIYIEMHICTYIHIGTFFAIEKLAAGCVP